MSSPLEYAVVAPLGLTAGGGILALALNAVLRRSQTEAERTASEWDRGAILADARIGTIVALLCVGSLILAIYSASFVFSTGGARVFDPSHPLLTLDPLSSFAIALVGTATLLCLVLSIAYLPAVHIRRGEHYGLLMISTAGIVLLVCAADLVAVFLGIELMTVPLYVLAGLDLRRPDSAEAAVKLVVTSAFGSAVLLFGMALLYGTTGETSIAALARTLGREEPLALAGLAVVLVGFGFKLGAFPFHAWVPDVLHGAPTVLASFFSAAVKVGVFVALLRLLVLALPEQSVAGVATERVQTSLSWLAAATLIVGAAMALVQTNVKRMLAHAGVAHTGMLLLGLACATERAHGAVLFYLLTYAFMSLGVFAVLIAMSQGGRDCESLEAFAGLGSSNPMLAAAMALFLLALAGLPGTAGFMARFELFVSAVDAGEITLVVIASLASMLLLACHLRIVIAMYMRARSSRNSIAPGSGELLVLIVCAVAVLYLGFLSHADPFDTGFRALEAARQAAAFAR